MAMDDDDHVILLNPPTKLDYSLTGENAARAIERGLAEADWYQTPVPRATMRKLLERRDGPGLRDCLIWFGLIIASAVITAYLWPSWWAAIPYLIFATLFSSTSDARWHEAGHGTAFKTDWMNNVLYEIASFMVKRESDVWRWSHTRHHSDTIIVGRDPEIAVPRPPDLKRMFRTLWGITNCIRYFKKIALHSMGQVLPDERTFIPESEFTKIFWKARVLAAIYLFVVGLSLYLHSWLPAMLILFPAVFGSGLIMVYGMTQHAGLAENVLDHRLNCRTIYMNRINRFLY